MPALQTTALAAGLALIATAAVVSIGANYTAGESPLHAETQLTGSLTNAVQVARGSANGGATVAVAASGTHDVVTVYDGRPDPAETVVPAPLVSPDVLPNNVTVSAPGIAAAPPFAIFIAKDGTSVVGVWSAGQGAIAEPTCSSGSQTIEFANGSRTLNATLSCASTTLATPSPQPTGT